MSKIIAPKTIAIQMDPPARLRPASDTSFALAEEAGRRGYTVYHYQTDTLQYHQCGRVLVRARQWQVDVGKIPAYTEGPPVDLDLRTVDVVLIRQDPPFDMNYVSTTYILEQLSAQGVRVLNHPRAVRVGDHKMPQAPFADMMPPTLITRDITAIQQFWDEHTEIVIKPLHGNGGLQVFHLKPGDDNLPSLLELFTAQTRAPLIVQKFLPQVREGDKRILLLNGELLAAINRRPPKGQIRSNLVVGGVAEACTLTSTQENRVARLAPWLREQGIYFAGLDMIGDYITEINITSPTGFRAADQLYGWRGDQTCAAKFWAGLSSEIR